MRTSRCTPASEDRWPKAYSPWTITVALLIPASSPAWMSVMSRLKPRRSHQRKYMRSSISAQSWLSVPPAPALMVRMALARSCSPPSMFWSSAPSIVASNASRAGPRSFWTSSPFASHSTRTCASSSCVFRRFNSPSWASIPLRRCISLWAARWSFQKSGSDIFSSRGESSACSLSASKIAADVRGPRDQRGEAL